MHLGNRTKLLIIGQRHIKVQTGHTKENIGKYESSPLLSGLIENATNKSRQLKGKRSDVRKLGRWVLSDRKEGK